MHPETDRSALSPSATGTVRSKVDWHHLRPGRVRRGRQRDSALDMTSGAFVGGVGRLRSPVLPHVRGRQHGFPVTTLNWTGQPMHLQANGHPRPPTKPSPAHRPPHHRPPHPPQPTPSETRSELVEARRELEQLKHALDSRAIIDQARGMVMALGPCTPEHAWQALVETSQRSNTKLRIVATDLVATTDGRQLPGPVHRALSAALRRHRS